jgi:hypothetical protein
MKTDIDYKKFLDFVHDRFKDSLSLDDVEKILSLEEDYNKDNPKSSGKALHLDRLVFTGIKHNGVVIAYDQEFFNGFYVWIADNQRGKSSIFKIIKYVLTGDNGVKPDVRSWLKEVFLEFSIGTEKFTVYLDKQSRVSSGGLYRTTYQDLLCQKVEDRISAREDLIVMEFKGDAMFSAEMEKFFFEHFSYYTLHYTKKNSRKDEFTLETANLTWNTYFKTIYLDSGSHGKLFFTEESIGQQGKKIFEMILGLPLTFPLNRLSYQLDLENESLGLLRLGNNQEIKKNQADRLQIEEDLTKNSADLAAFSTLETDISDTTALIKEQIFLQDQINKKLKSSNASNKAYQNVLNQRDAKQRLVQEYIEQKSELEAEILKSSKYLLNMQTYQAAGSFFTDLEVLACPHCEKSVSMEKIEKEQTDHDCRLCGEKSTVQKVDDQDLVLKIEIMEADKSAYESSLRKLNLNIDTEKNTLEDLQQRFENAYAGVIAIGSVETEQSRLEEIEILIAENQKKRTAVQDKEKQLQKLREDRAILLYRQQTSLGLEKASAEDAIEKLYLKISLIKFAIESLQKKRKQLNVNILDKLEGLILNEIQTFGLKNITAVEINEKYDLVLIQNGQTVNFGELTESERLRVKFAFYLSIIQLDIEFKLGRHPRFLIFDSPGSEEISKANLDGLSSIFTQVNQRFGNELQVFLGTTLQEFQTVADQDHTFISTGDELLF